MTVILEYKHKSTCTYCKTLPATHSYTHAHTSNGTSCDLVPAGTQRLKEAEAVDGDQSSGVQDT